MAVESVTISVVYSVTSAGEGQEFPIPFPYIDKENVIAYSVTDGEATNLTYGTDYTVNNSTLTVTGALTVGSKLVIHRVTPLTQEIVWVDGQAVYTPDIMQADDKLTFIAQEMQEQINRAIKVDASSAKTSEELLNDIWEARDDAAESASDSSDYADASAASALLAQAWAESDTAPDAEDEDSKSAKTWASVGEARAMAWAESDDPPDANDSTSKSAKSWAEAGAANAQAWAESASPPDASDNTSKSAKTWAGEAAQSASAALAAKNSVPNFTISTSDPTANDGVNGDVWFTYETA